MDQKELWKNTLATLEVEVSKANFATFLNPTDLVSLDQQTATIACPNSLVAERIKNKYGNLIKETLSDLTGSEYELDFEIRRQAPAPAKEADLGPLFNQKGRADGLFATYTFESFVVGHSNQLAHTAAQAVAREPGALHNPLLLYSSTGLGKTHLMHAIGNTIKSVNQDAKICYCSAERFTSEMIAAIQDRKTAVSFKRRFRSVDLLMIDDIQFLAGREATQEEFFNTFNELYLAGKQIILTSDRHPQEIKDLEARLVSRFAGGTVVDIQAPDVDLRTAILMQKAKEKGMTVNEKIIFSLAERIVGSIRQLEGTLNQLLLLAQTHQGASSEELIELIVGQPTAKASISPEKIIQKVCREFNLNKDELAASRRTKEVVLPRQMAMYLLRESCDLSLERIGELLGGRDHSTVLYGIKTAEKRINNDSSLQGKITTIKNSF